MEEAISNSLRKEVSIKLTKSPQIEEKVLNYLSKLGKCWSCLGVNDNITGTSSVNDSDKIVQILKNSTIPQLQINPDSVDFCKNCCSECVKILNILLDLETELDNIKAQIDKNLILLSDRRKIRIQPNSSNLENVQVRKNFMFYPHLF